MQKEEDVANEVDAFVAQKMGDVNGLMTSYILVAEVIAEDGVDMHVAISDKMTPWKAAGMLSYAQDFAAVETWNGRRETGEEETGQEEN